MDTAAFLHLAHDLVDAEPGSLGLDDRLADIGWDSLSNVEFIAHVDLDHGVALDASGLDACTTLEDVLVLTRRP